MELHDQIRIARERIGLSQDELADKLHVSKTAVDNWETGAVPRKEKLLKLQEIFGVTLYVAGTPEPSEQNNPYGITPDDLELLIKVKQLPLEQHEAIMRLIGVMSASSSTDNKSFKEFVSTKTQAAAGTSSSNAARRVAKSRK